MRKFKYSPIVFVLALMLAVVSYGFAATNTVPESYAGEGDGDISGVVVSNIDYTLNDANPSVITGVSFTVTDALPTTATVKVSIGTTAATPVWSTWTNCTSTDGSNWTCTGMNASVLTAGQLRVVTAN